MKTTKDSLIREKKVLENEIAVLRDRLDGKDKKEEYMKETLTTILLGRRSENKDPFEANFVRMHYGRNKEEVKMLSWPEIAAEIGKLLAVKEQVDLRDRVGDLAYKVGELTRERDEETIQDRRR